MIKLKRFWAWPRELKEKGVLGINARNLKYLFEYNSRDQYQKVDNKIITKLICREHDIPVPELYYAIGKYSDLKFLERILGDRGSFVIKPAHGAEGRGVIVVQKKICDNEYQMASGKHCCLNDLRYHIVSIISGLYSLAGHPDSAMIEERITPAPIFLKMTTKGTPDIRVILFRNIPIMAMLRLPTRCSKGRANLHQGAVAVGIDLPTGVTRGGVYRNQKIACHPDTGVSLQGLAIPNWDKILTYAGMLANLLMGLDYIGVDIMLSSNDQPMILEVNARPGLSIQIANNQGLVCQAGNDLGRSGYNYK